MPVATPDSYPGTPGTPLYAGRASPPVGGLVTTMRLTNPTGAAQPAGFVSKTVGLPFGQGDIPAGDWPQLTTADNTPCPATFWGATTWPDGSLKFVGCMARIPVAVPAGTSIDILVKRGGTLDTTPTRTTADLTAADLKLVCQGTRALTGEWTASLNDGITTGPVVLLGSGPAGSLWRIGSEFRDGSNAAHGQLYHHHFVAALTNSVGGVAGLRYLGRSMQHWGDVLSPIPTNREFTAELRSGATTVRAMTGVAPNASRVSGPPGVLGSTISMPHYTSWFTAGAGAEYDFLPGTQTTECAAYWGHESTYLATCGAFPRMDVTISGTVNMTPVDYVPYGKGNFESYDIGGASRQSEIGAMNQMAALHMINQSAEALRVVRINGMVFGGIGVGVLDRVNQAVFPCVDFSEVYANMLPPIPTIRLNQSSEMVGNGPMVAISDKASVWRASDITHRPGVCWYPYLVTGEPQYLDMLVESAGHSIITMAAGTGTLSTDFPVTNMTTSGGSTQRNLILNGVTYPGTGWYARTELPRMFAWAIREMGHVAAFYPDVCPRGTGTKRYFSQIVDKNMELARDYRAHQTAIGNVNYVPQGHHFYYQTIGSGFALPHLHQTICHLSSAYPTANTIGFRQHLSRFWNALSENIDIACISTYVYSTGNAAGRTTTLALTTFQANSDVMQCSFDSGTSTVTIVGSLPWVPTAGDKFQFRTSTTTTGSFRPFDTDGLTPYYAVNVSGLSFQLAATPGGAPIPFTNGSAGTADFFCALQNYPALYAFQRSNSAEGYFANARGSILAARAAGDDVESAYAKMQAKMPLVTIGYSSNPKFAYAGASNTSGA